MNKLLIAATGVLLGMAPVSQAATLAADGSNLSAVFGKARPGDVIVLTGRVPPTTLANRRFSPPLTLEASKAEVVGLSLASVAGIRICGGDWMRTAAENSASIRIDRSSNVTIDQVQLLGPGALTPPSLARGYGVQILNSTEIEVLRSTVAGFRSGVTMYDVDGFTVAGNAFVGMSADGFIGGSVRRGLIADNTARGFKIIKDEHPDGIQLFSPAGLPPSSDVLITRNQITGDTEGIGLYPGGNERGYDRIEITQNEIAVTYPPAIATYGVRGLILRDNKVRTLPGAANRASIHQYDSTDVERSGNTVAAGAGTPGEDDPKAKKRKPGELARTFAPPRAVVPSLCPARS